MENEKLKEIASQLRQPHGAKGTEMAEVMNDTNIKMTYHAIDQLKINDNDSILELGHGNCGHLGYLLQQKANLKYQGLEISDLMQQSAQELNEVFVNSGQASFHLYDGLGIPFQDNSFDRIFTVNTIYFWADPIHLMGELCRVLKPNGILNITFADEKFMAELPFTQFGFELYDMERIKTIVKPPFKIVSSDSQTETIKSKTGESVNRIFTTATITKEVQ
ncbi:class I SAM-dependent methyltransferase [Belliella marina]|uniref:Class I SAM-dependent methyltransferase n=1 Tax=Belliella marina TaxID=1644146 RepID=A0ABW4VJ20_9BACT